MVFCVNICGTKYVVIFVCFPLACVNVLEGTHVFEKQLQLGF